MPQTQTDHIINIHGVQEALKRCLQMVDAATTADIAKSLLIRSKVRHSIVIRTTEDCPWGPPAAAPVTAPAILQAIAYKDNTGALCWAHNDQEALPPLEPSVYPLQPDQLLFFYRVAATDKFPAHKFYTTSDQLHKYVHLSQTSTRDLPT